MVMVSHPNQGDQLMVADGPLIAKLRFQVVASPESRPQPQSSRQKRMTDIGFEAWPSAVALIGFLGLIWIERQPAGGIRFLFLNLFTFLVGFGLVWLWIRTRIEPGSFEQKKQRKLKVSIEFFGPASGTTEAWLDIKPQATLQDVLAILGETSFPGLAGKLVLPSRNSFPAPFLFNPDQLHREANLDVPVQEGKSLWLVFAEGTEM